MRAAWLSWAAAAICGTTGFVVFQYFGNATRGYIDTASVFWWWSSQWINPAAETEHGPIILCLSAWLLWRNLHISRSAKPDAGQRAGFAAWRHATGALWPFLAALALHALGYLVQQTRLSIAALLLFTWGVLRLGGGPRWGRAAAFPLILLLFAVPAGFLETVGFHLRLGVIAVTEHLAHAAGVDVIRNGTQLFAPDGRYQYDVAAACSGVRSLMALLALSLLIGYLNLRSLRRRLLVFLLAFPLTFVGNVIRIAAVVLAGQWAGQRAGVWVHDWAGFLVFVVVLGGVQLAAARLARREPTAPTAPEPSCNPMGYTSSRPGGSPAVHRTDSSLEGKGLMEKTGLPGVADAALAAARPCNPLGYTTGCGEAGGSEGGGGAGAVAGGEGSAGAARTGTVGLAAAVVALGAVTAWFTTRVDALLVPAGAGVVVDAQGQPAGLPPFIGTEWIGQAAEVTAIEREVLPADTGYSRRTYTSLEDRRRQVFLSVVLSGRDRTSIHRPELCLVGQGWTIQRRDETAFAHPAGGRVPAALLRLSRDVVAPDGRRRTVGALFAYWYVGRDALVTSTGARMWHTALNRLRLQPDRWAYVVAQTLIFPEEDEAAARARLQEVLTGTLPEFQVVPTE